jgi:hypothetical protein
MEEHMDVLFAIDLIIALVIGLAVGTPLYFLMKAYENKGDCAQ